MEKIVTKTFKTNDRYCFLKIFNFVLMSLFKLVLLYMVIDSIIIGDKDRTLLVVLTSLTCFYRAYIKWFTGVKISVVMQIITTTFIICGSLFGTLMGMFNQVEWWDTFLHLLSGILLAFFGVMILAVMKDKKSYLRYSVMLIVIFAFLVGVTGGIVWELMEFSADTFLDYDAQRSKGVEYGVLDTMIDIVADTSGSLITAIGLWIYLRKKDEEEIYKLLNDWFVVPKEEYEQNESKLWPLLRRKKSIKH